MLTRDKHGHPMFIQLDNVLHVPNLTQEGLISDAKLLDSGMQVVLNRTNLTRSLEVLEPSGLKRVLPLHVEDGLYKLAYHPKRQQPNANAAQVKDTAKRRALTNDIL